MEEESKDAVLGFLDGRLLGTRAVRGSPGYDPVAITQEFESSGTINAIRPTVIENENDVRCAIAEIINDDAAPDWHFVNVPRFVLLSIHHLLHLFKGVHMAYSVHDLVKYFVEIILIHLLVIKITQNLCYIRLCHWISLHKHSPRPLLKLTKLQPLHLNYEARRIGPALPLKQKELIKWLNAM